MYDTTNAYYNCTFPNDKCTLSVPLFGTNAAVLTSPGPKLVCNPLLVFLFHSSLQTIHRAIQNSSHWYIYSRRNLTNQSESNSLLVVQNNSKTEFCAKLSYEPRWIAYIVCMGNVLFIITCVISTDFFRKTIMNFCFSPGINYYRCSDSTLVNCLESLQKTSTSL